MKPVESYTMTYIGVHALIRNAEGKVLIIQRCETNRYKPLMWDVPGGKMQTGEDVETALRREVEEETGLVLAEIRRPLSVYANTTQLPVREDVQIVFDCSAENPDAGIRLNEYEHSAWKWVLPQELPEYDIMAYLACCYEKVIKYEN